MAPLLLIRDDDTAGIPDRGDTGRNIGIVIASMIAVIISVATVVKLCGCTLGRNDEERDGSRGYLNAAEVMRLCALRSRSNSHSADGKGIAYVDSQAPELRYKDLQTLSSSGKNCSIQPPPPVALRKPALEEIREEDEEQGEQTAVPTQREAEHQKDGPLVRAASCDESAVCSICLEDFLEEDIVRQTMCAHVFHSDCLMKWLAGRGTRCPLCQTALDQSAEDV